VKRFSLPVLVPSIVGVLALLGPAGAGAQECGARVTVRQVGMKANEDGTRTLKYRARVEAATESSQCAKVSFTVMRSYIRTDGQKLEDGIPVAVEADGRVEVEGEDILATSKLVYWWADRVSCQPCAEMPAEKQAAKTVETKTIDASWKTSR
jgi:hypothetical protein